MNWYKLLPPPLRPKNAAPGKPLIDTEYLGETVENSPVPVILTLTLIWMVSAVLLTLSDGSDCWLKLGEHGYQLEGPDCGVDSWVALSDLCMAD